MHAYGSSSRASATRRRPRASWCPGWCARRLSPAARPWDTRLDDACPPVGRWGLTAPRAPGRCAATPATGPSQGPALGARSPIPCRLPWCVVAPQGSWPGRSAQTAPGPGGARSPRPGMGSRRPVALPRARLPPLKPCPARRPRWWPAPAPQRTQDGGLPAPGNRRLPTTLPLSGLPHAACLRAPPGSVRPLTGRHAGARRTGGRGFPQGGLAP